MNEDIKQAIREVLDERRSINSDDHAADHLSWRQYGPAVLEFMEERKEKRARCRRIRERVSGSLFLSFIMGVLTFIGWLGSWAMNHLHFK